MEKLFRNLDSESYIKGEDPPAQALPTSGNAASSRPSNVPSPSPVQSSKSDGSDRKQSEDVRHKEVREVRGRKRIGRGG